MERSFISYSEGTDAEANLKTVVGDIKNKAENNDPILIVFASEVDNFKTYSKKLHEEFPKTTVIGESSMVLYCSEGSVSHNGLETLTVMSGIEVQSGVLKDITTRPEKHASEITDCLSKMSSTNNTICVEFCTAFVNSEELILDTFKSVLKNTGIEICGSSAGKEYDFSDFTNLISLNGEVFGEACVYAFVRNMNGRIGLFKENMYRPTEHKFTVTDADVDERIVYEFDNRPAGEVFRQTLRIGPESYADNLLFHPIGRLVGDEVFITQGLSVNEDDSMTFFAKVYNRTNVVVLELEDINKTWGTTAERIKEEGYKPSFSIVFNCSARTLIFEHMNKLIEYSDALSEYYGKYIGLSGFGEQLRFEHLNQTMVIAVFE